MCAANVTSQRKALRSQWNNGCEMKRNDGRPVAAHGARLHEPPRAVMLWGIGCRAMVGCVRQILDRAASSITYLRVALGARRRGICGDHESPFPRKGFPVSGLAQWCAAATLVGCAGVTL